MTIPSSPPAFDAVPLSAPAASKSAPVSSLHARSVTPSPVPMSASGPGGSSTKQRCPNCGADVTGFSFCGLCGTRVTGATGVPKSPARGLSLGSQAGPSRVTRGKLVLIRPDGSEGGSWALHEGPNLVGRGTGPLFDADNYLSPRHAELILGSAGLIVRDVGSLNGVFAKLVEEEEIVDRDIFRIGQELLRFDAVRPSIPLEDGTHVMGSPNPGYWGRLTLILGVGQDGSAFPLSGDAVVLGRERGDILFPEDGYVSGTHARLARRGERIYIADMNSSNGTFIRIRGERTVRPGAYLLMGQQLFRVQYT